MAATIAEDLAHLVAEKAALAFGVTSPAVISTLSHSRRDAQAFSSFVAGFVRPSEDEQAAAPRTLFLSLRVSDVDANEATSDGGMGGGAAWQGSALVTSHVGSVDHEWAHDADSAHTGDSSDIAAPASGVEDRLAADLGPVIVTSSPARAAAWKRRCLFFINTSNAVAPRDTPLGLDRSHVMSGCVDNSDGSRLLAGMQDLLSRILMPSCSVMPRTTEAFSVVTSTAEQPVEAAPLLPILGRFTGILRETEARGVAPEVHRLCFQELAHESATDLTHTGKLHLWISTVWLAITGHVLRLQMKQLR